MAAHVDEMQIGQGRIAEAGRQVDGRVAPCLAVDLAFDRRRRRNQHDRKAGETPAHHRHVTGIVEDAVFLLVGGIVLFIDNDQAEILEGQEQRRTGAGHHPHLAGHRLPPDLFAHAR